MAKQDRKLAADGEDIDCGSKHGFGRWVFAARFFPNSACGHCPGSACLRHARKPGRA